MALPPHQTNKCMPAGSARKTAFVDSAWFIILMIALGIALALAASFAYKNCYNSGDVNQTVVHMTSLDHEDEVLDTGYRV